MHARGYYLLSTEMKVIVISNLLYEQSERIYFWTSQNTRAAQKIKLNGKCIVPPVRGDVTFVWESVRNHVIVIRVNEENSYGSILHRLSELVNVTLRLIIKIL